MVALSSISVSQLLEMAVLGAKYDASWQPSISEMGNLMAIRCHIAFVVQSYTVQKMHHRVSRLINSYLIDKYMKGEQDM